MSLEASQTELAPVRTALARVLASSIATLHRDVRAEGAAINDLARENVTPGRPLTHRRCRKRSFMNATEGRKARLRWSPR